MEFKYYYGSEADQFSFIRIPRALITDSIFEKLSLQAKMLYAILLDRMTLSRKNSWFDEENRVYIIYPINEIQDDLGFSRKKAMEYLKELQDFGLVEKKKRGFGLPSIIYVKSFLVSEAKRSAETNTSGIVASQAESRSVRMGTSGSAGMGTSYGVGMGTSVVPEQGLQEVLESAPLKSNIYMNHIYRSENKSNQISSAGDTMGCDADELQAMKAYEQIIKDNIEYDVLMHDQRFDVELVNGIFELILETVLCKSDSILISSSQYPTALVRSKFLKLNYEHVQYVMDCFSKNTTKVMNIKKYLLAALFNAPSTMSGYYRAEVNHDFPQYVAQ